MPSTTYQQRLFMQKVQLKGQVRKAGESTGALGHSIGQLGGRLGVGGGCLLPPCRHGGWLFGKFWSFGCKIWPTGGLERGTGFFAVTFFIVLSQNDIFWCVLVRTCSEESHTYQAECRHHSANYWRCIARSKIIGGICPPFPSLVYVTLEWMLPL